MSAIGDYIHLHKNNYLKYGTARYGRPQPLYDSYKAQKSRNISLINSIPTVPDKIIDELRERISKESLQNRAASLAKILVNNNDKTNIIGQKIAERLSKDIPLKVMFDKMSFKSEAIKFSTDSIDLKKARQARENFISAIGTVNKHSEDGGKVRKNTIEAIKRNLNIFFNSIGIINSSYEDFLRLSDKELENMDTLSALKQVMDLSAFQDASKSALHGVFGEVLVNMASDSIINRANEVAVETIKSALDTGLNKTEFHLDPNFINKNVQQVYKQKTGHILYEAQSHSSQDKVDASIVINDHPVEASVKAYTPKSNGITASLEKVNLIYTLASTEAQFANHWINLHAHNIKDLGMDDTLKEYMKYQALVHGNMLKQGVTQADTFVIINLDTGEIFAKTTKDILTDNGGGSFTFYPSIESFSFAKDNNRQATIEERIANILNTLHQTKVKVSYKVSF